MARRTSRKPKLEAPWLAYTDLLSSTLLILSVVVVASVLARLTNEKPPVIRLSDAKDYRFARGSFEVNKAFRSKLISEELPKIDRAIQCYAIDTIEIIGHTDNSPNTGLSNIDKFPKPEELTIGFKNVYAGSNADLGLLRAFSVQTLLEEEIGRVHPQLEFKSYSASSLINPGDKSDLDANTDREKRRIEIRLTRSSNQSVINKC
jgi:outer membrane protein OmpA-like peptidoglycan-associated protein